MSKHWENKLLKKSLSEKYIHEEDDMPEMTKEDRKAFLEAVANYHQLGEMIYRANTLKEVASTLSNIVEMAENVTLQESEHWFDNVTVSRHMKQLKEAHKVFEKTAVDMTEMQQRLEAAYDDMGSILNKYYKVNESLR